MRNTNPPRALIWSTLVLLIVVAGIFLIFSHSSLPDAVKIKIKGQPTIGYRGAKVHIIAFEEPKCFHCREFTLDIMPKIKKEFIDTHKVTYTVVPISFLPGSMPAAIAMWCVYNSSPLYPNSDLFFTYLDFIYKHAPAESEDWATQATLIDYAEQASPAIPTAQLKKCLDMEAYRLQIEKNTAYAQKLMDGMVATPTVYVNGIKVEELSYDKLKTLIERVLDHEGVAN